jgi:hypothetical protein
MYFITLLRIFSLQSSLYSFGEKKKLYPNSR